MREFITINARLSTFLTQPEDEITIVQRSPVVLRQAKLASWVAEKLKTDNIELSMASGDASFRRYFRCHHAGRSWIAMDAPPEQENSHSFVAIAKYWQRNNIETPQIYAADLSLGFLLLDDFGDLLLLSELHPEHPQQQAADYYYGVAMKALLRIQNLSPDPDYPLPDYDRALLHQEMELFRHWLLDSKLGLKLSEKDNTLLDNSFNTLAENALTQPQVPVHRDYHARNLMVLNDKSLGVLDFQDAVLGPVSYDLVSLLRDCYIVWPDSEVDKWCRQYHSMALSSGLVACDFAQFKIWFDLMGIQRHLKASGIFARLSLRDGKHDYLESIPRTVNYIARISRQYHLLHDFNSWLESRVVPQLSRLGNTP